MMKNAQLLTEMERLEKSRLTKKSKMKIKALQSRVAELESIIAERDMRPSVILAKWLFVPRLPETMKCL